MDIRTPDDRQVVPVAMDAGSGGRRSRTLLAASHSCALGCAVLAAAGAVCLWYHRFAVNTDGVSYIEISDAISRGQWSASLNGYWSPLFCWLLAPFQVVLRPDPSMQFPVAHVLNYVIYLWTLASFTWLLKELIERWFRSRELGPEQVRRMTVAWCGLGYALFGIATLVQVTISMVSPDLLVVMFVFLGATFVLRISDHATDLRAYCGLGICLGLAGLAKTAMLPLGGALLFGLILAHRKRARFPLAATACFAILTGPFVMALSSHFGRFTFGESGRINWAWFVTGRIPLSGWDGSNRMPGTGFPIHSPRHIFEHPVVLEFDGPIKGVYPLWHSPAYWMEGMSVPFHLPTQIQILIANLWGVYCLPYLRDFGFLVAAIVICRRVLPGRKERFTCFPGFWLVLWAGAAYVEYALCYTEPRYLAGFFVLLFVSLLYRATSGAARGSCELCVTVFWICAAGLAAPQIVKALARVSAAPLQGGVEDYEPLRIARELRRMAVRTGDKIATVGSSDYSYPWRSWGWNHYFAFIGGYRIVAEVPDDQVAAFWQLGSASQADLFERLAAHRIRAILTKNYPMRPPAPVWKQVPHSNYYIHLFP